MDLKRAKLLPSAKNTDDATNLIVASDNRVEFSLLGQGGEVYCILAERIEALFGRTAFNSPIAANLFDCRDERRLRKASLLQHGGHRGGFDERREDVVLRDIKVVHRLLQTLCVAQHAKRLGGQRDVIWWRGLGRKSNNDALQCAFDEPLAGGWRGPGTQK
jgi:hypothetical protein